MKKKVAKTERKKRDRASERARGCVGESEKVNKIKAAVTMLCMTLDLSRVGRVCVCWLIN